MDKSDQTFIYNFIGLRNKIPIKNLNLHFFLYLCVLGGVFCVMAQIWRSGNSLQEPVLSFHYVDSSNQTKAVRLGSSCL